jgi:hypothetical protein
MLAKVNVIRDEIKSQHEERERLVRDHNQSVRDALKTPDQDEGLVDSLSQELMESGSITFGGTVAGSEGGESNHRGGKRPTRRLRTTRGKKS